MESNPPFMVLLLHSDPQSKDHSQERLIRCFVLLLHLRLRIGWGSPFRTSHVLLRWASRCACKSSFLLAGAQNSRLVECIASKRKLSDGWSQLAMWPSLKRSQRFSSNFFPVSVTCHLLPRGWMTLPKRMPRSLQLQEPLLNSSCRRLSWQPKPIQGRSSKRSCCSGKRCLKTGWPKRRSWSRMLLRSSSINMWRSEMPLRTGFKRLSI